MDRGIFRGLLDDRQRAIFALILEGRTGREIAAVLGMTRGQVESVVRKTCRQVGVASRHDAARIIAIHYSGKAGRSASVARQVDTSGIRHFDRNTQTNATRTAQTDREQKILSGYVRDAGDRVLEKDQDAGAYSEITDQFSLSKFLIASLTAQRVMLAVLLMASSTLALSALVSAMQGLDVLMFS